MLRSCNADYLDIVIPIAKKWKELKCFGEKAVQIILNRLSSGRPEYILLAEDLVEREKEIDLRKEDMDNIKKILIKIALEDEWYNRASAIHALSKFKDEELIPFLNRI